MFLIILCLSAVFFHLFLDFLCHWRHFAWLYGHFLSLSGRFLSLCSHFTSGLSLCVPAVVFAFYCGHLPRLVDFSIRNLHRPSTQEPVQDCVRDNNNQTVTPPASLLVLNTNTRNVHTLRLRQYSVTAAVAKHLPQNTDTSFSESRPKTTVCGSDIHCDRISPTQPTVICAVKWIYVTYWCLRPD